MGMMRTVFAALVVGAALAGCGGTGVKECVNGCPQGQKCDTATGICVKDSEPTVSVESIPNLLTSSRISLRGTATDDLGVTKGEAFFEGQSPVAFTVTDNTFTVELDAPQLDSAEASVTVRVFDTAEQKAETRLTTVVDILGPTVAISAPSQVIGGPSVSVAGVAQDGSGEVSLVQADFGSGATTATVASDNSWTVQLAPPAGRDAEETPISIRAKDKYGNERTTALSVTVDSKGPSFSLTAPTGTVGGMTAAVSGTTTDTSGAPTSVTVRFGGLAQDVTVADGGFTATIALPQDLDGEARPVTLTAVDRFGNSGSQNFDITIDTRGPTLALTGPAVVGATGTLTGTAVDSALPVSNVTVNVQGSAGPVPVDSLTNGVWTLAVTFPGGIDGVARSVALSGRDARGNVGSGNGSFIVDTVAPVGAFTSPAANARLTGPTASFSGTVTDTTSVASVELDFADGQGFRAATVTGNTWTVSVPLSATEDDVAHLVTARFTDAVGNAATVSRTVTVDNVAPTLSVTSPAGSAVVGGTATTVAVSVDAVDPGGVAGVSVALGTGAVVMATRQGSTNTWTATIPLPTGQDFVTIPLRAIATDVAGNARATSVDVIVDNVAPVLTITAPTANQVFNISNFTASGNVTISWTVTDGDPQASVKTVGGTAPGPGTSAAWPTVTTDNYVPYNLAVVASDRMNNSVTRNATFIVDRVAPTVSISPANGSRNADPRTVTFTFSEEMSGTPADPHVLTPLSSAPAGAWQGATRTQFVRSGLEPYAVFTATTAAGVTDRAGNPVTPATSRFHTSAQLPVNGTAIAGSVWAYDVASDPDGLPMVITVTEAAPNYDYATYQMAGATGAFSAWSFAPTAQASVRGYQAYAWRTVNADLTATPIRGAWEDGTETVCAPTCNTQTRTRRAYAIGAVAPTVELFGNLVPSPAISGADGTGAIGFFNGETYTRSPSVSFSLGLTPARVAPGSVRWNIAAAPALLPPTNTAAEVWVSSYTCTGVVSFPILQYYCFPVASQVVNDAAPSASWAKIGSAAENMSLATAENGCTLLSYPSVSSGRRVVRINDTNSRAPCPGPGVCLYALSTTPVSAPTSDFVVGKGAGNALLGVGTVGGWVQLYQTTDCGTWTPVGAPLSGAIEAKPTLVGAKPGFFYLDAARTLRVHVP